MDTPPIKKSIFDIMRERPVYLWDEYEQGLVRTTPSGDTFFKFKGEKEWQLEKGKPTHKPAFETMLHGEEITQEEYEAL